MEPPTQFAPAVYKSSNRLQGHGNDYQRLAARTLLQRATLNGCDFRMGFEIEEAGKFDDIGMQLNGEWFLIQTKHSQPSKGGTDKVITKEILFDTGPKLKDESFQLMKYLKDGNKFSHGKIKHFIIFTNRNVEPGDFYSTAELDEMFKFSSGTNIKLKSDDMINALKDKAFQRDFDLILKAVRNLFNDCSKDAILDTYQAYLNEIITLESRRLHLATNFETKNPAITKLYEKLKKPLKDKSVPISDESDFWAKNPKPIKLDIDEETVRDFFSKLILSVAQPNVKQLKQDMINESRLWMRTWIRPDDFGRLEPDFFERPMNAIKEEFDKYEKMVPERAFLQGNDGKIILDQVKAELSVQIRNNSRRSCSGLVETGYYYINRRIKSNQGGMIQDTEFVEQLYTTFSNQNTFLLTAQPGMGKSTLWQYLAFEAQKTHTESAVFLIYLNNLPHDMPTVEKLEDIVTSKIFDSDLSKSNVELIVKEDKKQIALFFDAFDEIRASQDSVLELFTVLLGKSNVKIIISGRKHAKDTLEKHFNVTSRELQEFDRVEQMSFLQKFWKQGDDSVKCRTFSQTILDKFDQDIARKDYEFTGLPLMIRMVAEVYAGQFEKYLSLICELKEIIPEEKLSIKSLYEQFTQKCIKITMNKKFNVDNNRELDPFFNPLVEKVDFDYQVLAVERFNFLPTMKDANHYKILHSFEQNITNQQSLIVELVQDKLRFTHLSLGEYYAAKYLFNLFCKKRSYVWYDDFFSKIYEKVYYENIRNFFLAMVDAQISPDSKLNKITFDCLRNKDTIVWSCKRDYVQIVKHFYNNESYKTIRDEDKKSLLQISIESLSKKTEHFLLQKGAYKHLVHVAVECNRLDLLNSDENSTADESSQKCVKLFKYLADNNTSFELRNDTGDTLLHAAVKNGDLKLIDEIFNFRDSNEFHLSECIFCKNNDEETPLHVAAKGKIDIISFLFKQSLKNNQMAPVDCNPTLLGICRHYKTDGIMKIAIEQALKRNEINEKSIIEACKLIGMDVNAENSEKKTVLHLAAEKNCRQLAVFLHQNGANLNSNHCWKKTPLHLAVENNSFEVAEFLISVMSDIGELTDSDGNTALHVAARLKDPKCLNLLIEKYSTLKLLLDTKNRNGMSALHCAIKRERKESVRILLRAGAHAFAYDSGSSLIQYLKSAFELTQTTFNSECEKSKQLLEKIGFDSRLVNCKYALNEAAKSGWVELVKFLIANQFNVNLRNDYRQTPLMLASTKEIYDLLVSAGATENLKDRYDNTGMHIAAENNWIEIVHYLSEKNPSLVNCKNWYEENPLHCAAEKGHEEIVAILIANNADIDAKNKNGRTLADYALTSWRANVVRFLLNRSPETVAAVWQGLQIMIENDRKDRLIRFTMKLDMVKVLLEKGLNVNEVYENGLTILHAAARESKLDVVQLLVRAGADVDALDKHGNTPLHFAAENFDDIDVMGYLVEYSADINCQNKEGQTPLHRSIEKATQSAKILLARNACIHLKNNLNNTPLHLAIPQYDQNVALLLIDLKANVNEQNNDGAAPLHLAVLKNNFKIVKKLVKNGADLRLLNKDRKSALDLAAEDIYRRRISKYLAQKTRESEEEVLKQE